MTEINKLEFYSELGFEISEARKEVNMSQETLAAKIGLSRASVVNIEKGRQNPPLHVLIRIAEVLNTNLISLVPTSEESRIKPSLRREISKKEREGDLNAESVRIMQSFLLRSFG